MRKILLILLTFIGLQAFGQTPGYMSSLRFANVDTTSISQQNGKLFFNHTTGKLRIMYGGIKYTVWPFNGSGGGGHAIEYNGSFLTQRDTINFIGAGIIATDNDPKTEVTLDSDLNTIAGLSPSNDDFLQRKVGAWSNRTISQVKTDLGLSGTNSGDQTITLTGDVTGSGTGSFATTLATVNSNIGTFGSATQSLTATVNGKGLVTAISAQTVTPAVGSVTGLGTGVSTALGINVGSVGAFLTTSSIPVTEVTFDGQGSVVLVGTKAYIRVPQAGTISGWSIVAEGTSPTCTIDIWKVGTGTTLPTVSNTITASAKPALSMGNAVVSTTLTGWATTVTADDLLCVTIDACTAATKIHFLIYK